jgi:hypothetical protein
MSERLDHPFEEVVASAIATMQEGANVYQKYTCSGCGNRLGMEEPNKFYTLGTCDKCDAVTDIRKRGCNFMAVWGEPR